MQGFIEVKTLTDDSAILLPIVHITAVVERDYGTFIETGVDGKGRTIGMHRQGTVDKKQMYYGDRVGVVSQRDYNKAKGYGEKAKQKYIDKKNKKK